VAIKLHSAKPDSSDECALRIETSLVDKSIAEGAVTEARVKVTNTKDEAVPTPIALIGIPGGLEVRHDQLKELVKQQKIAAYEVLGRDVVLYWREMGAKQSIELPVSLIAAVPGEYAGPASRAYLYYTDELKQWSDPLKVKITPRAE
jgi:alpha-2-macroglobulin-like protein